ncbi:MAG TPA: DUF885 domain-containing protein [Steroidobacteraceae bacterium]
MQQRLAVIAASVLGLAIGAQALAATPEARADALVDDFVYGSLALAPATATFAGYHVHKGVRLDGRWDDYSKTGVARMRSFNLGLSQRLDSLQGGAMDAERQADLDIVRDSVGLNLLDFDRIQNYRHNPTFYVELIGNGLYNLYVLNSAPEAQRFGYIIERLQRLPLLVTQARANLIDAPEVWNRVAREENDGNIELIDKTLRAATPAALRDAYSAAAAPALKSLRDFNSYLATTLSKKTSDWRLGAENYRQKCGFYLHTGKSPAELLAVAEHDLAATRAEMAKVAAPRSVEEALAEVASEHATPATYMDEVRQTLAQSTAFVRQKDLLTLADNSNLAVIDTPVFMRGIYAVGGFNAAPALEPQLGAYYWVTPIPGDWPQARIDSKLREYNHYTLHQLTVHEAMPGHYVQAEYANRVQPLARRVLRNIWGNNAYIEGWAVYAQQMMTDEGYLDKDPKMRLALLKQVLRGEANTILDVRLQTMGMTDSQALDLMIKQTYQEREEATAKLQRAQLSSCQLAVYYAGSQGWNEVRAHFHARHPQDFSLKKFHEAALNEGAVPLATLDRLLH